MTNIRSLDLAFLSQLAALAASAAANKSSPAANFIPVPYAAKPSSSLTLLDTYTASTTGLNYTAQGDWVFVEFVGGGQAGYKDTNSGGPNAMGGGAGGYVAGWMRTSVLTSVTIGAGGTTSGQAGGDTIVGGITAYGGGNGTTPASIKRGSGGPGFSDSTTAAPVDGYRDPNHMIFHGGRGGWANQQAESVPDGVGGGGSSKTLGSANGQNGGSGLVGGGSAGITTVNSGGSGLGGAGGTGISNYGGGGAGLLASGGNGTTGNGGAGGSGGGGGGGCGGGSAVNPGAGGNGCLRVYKSS